NFTDVGEISPHYTLLDSTGAVVDLRDLSKFSVTQVRSRPQTGVDTRDGVSLDYKFPIKTVVPLTVKVGGRADITNRNTDQRVFNRTGTSVATGFGNPVTGQALVNLTDTTFSNHPIGFGQPAYNFPSVYRAFDQLGGTAYVPYTPASDVIGRFED